jgi:hypothetical protein
MPLLRGGRPLKRWRYVGVYGPELMLCVGDARIGGVPQRWWAVAFPDKRIVERTTVGRGGVDLSGAHARVRARGVEIDVEFTEAERVEVVSPHGGQYIWTAKQAGLAAQGHVTVAGERHAIDAEAFVDDSAGYHARHTAWRWSAGVGRAEDGRRVAWNLVTGVHDSRESSERTGWVDGAPEEVGPVEFANDLSRVGDLDFSAWGSREDNTNLLVMRSRYRQPFGTFRGTLPNGVRLARGYGVMEEHDVRW